MAAPVVASTDLTVAASSLQSCAPAVPVGVVAPAAAVSALAERQAAHIHRAADDPPQMRGPPAPLHTPSSPIATAGAGTPPAGGASGGRDFAIDGDAIVFELPDGDVAVAPQSSDHAAPASANAGARAPPVA